MTYDQVFAINGLGCNESKYLYGMALAAPAGAIVEIGVQYGPTAAILCAAADEKGEHYYGIDPWGLKADSDHYSGAVASDLELGAKRRIDKTGLTNYTLIRNFACIAAETFDNPIGFIFIDGCHCAECVKKDFFLWAPKLVPGGVMAFHDAGWATVAEALKFIVASPEFAEFHKVDSTKLETYMKNE